MARVAFEVSVTVLTEIWRRFVFQHDSFPTCLLSELLQAGTVPDFLEKYFKLKARGALCSRCVDPEFSKPFLAVISESEPGEQQKAKALRLMAVLRDISVWAPISSDLVECLHGVNQCRLHRWRGLRPTDETAQQLTVWASITTAYAKFKDVVWGRLGDKFAGNRLAQYGQPSTNQNSKPGDRRPRVPRMTVQDLQKLANEAPGATAGSKRKLCGWNMFQKEAFAARQYSPQEWQQKAVELGIAWRNLSAEDKEGYEAEARHQQHAVDEARLQPFASKQSIKDGNRTAPQGFAAFDAVSLLKDRSKTLKRVSMDRLITTQRIFQGADVWQEFNGGISCARGCLPLHAVDLNTTDAVLSARWNHAVKEPLTHEVPLPKDPSQVHHVVCQRSHGECMQLPHQRVAASLLAEMVKMMLSDGDDAGVSQGFEFH